MQFRNAVLTPKGIELLGAANINKPVVFTRFLFTDSTEPLFGSETDLPPNTWGNGSVDAVVNQGELGQFVIYASASNAIDYGYARGYGIYAKLRDEDTDHLVCVANALGNAVEVTESSGGYSRFHVALTIKYAVADNVVVVEPNLAGLISRGEFEDWMKRMVTKMSASGVPYGDDDMIYGLKTFATGVEIGYINMVGLARRLIRRMLTIYGNIRITDDIVPYYYAQDPSQSHNLGAENARWERLYVNEIHTPKAFMEIKLSGKLSQDSPITSFGETDGVSSGFVKFQRSEQTPPILCAIGYNYVNTIVNGENIKTIPNIMRSLEVALDASSILAQSNKIRWVVKIVGYTATTYNGDLVQADYQFASNYHTDTTQNNIIKVRFDPMLCSSMAAIRLNDAKLIITAEGVP